MYNIQIDRYKQVIRNFGRRSSIQRTRSENQTGMDGWMVVELLGELCSSTPGLAASGSCVTHSLAGMDGDTDD